MNNSSVDYGLLGNISIKPIITPFDKKNDLLFEMILFRYNDKEEMQPFFMCKFPSDSLKKLGQHLINCVDKCKDLSSKKIFKESHYKEFGLKIPKEDLIKNDYVG